MSGGFSKRPILQHVQVLPRLLQAGRAIHPAQVIRQDEADEGRLLETRLTDPADGSRLLVLGYDDAALIRVVPDAVS